MSGPVMWSVRPDPREGLMSLVVRTKTANFLPSAHILLRQIGAAHAHTPMAELIPDLDVGMLASILRQPEAEVARRHRAPSSEHGFVDSFGCTVRADEVGFRTRRFGPTAVGEAPVGRALWSLKTVPCCTEHWEYLVDACLCGTVQRWQSADRIDRCDACNAKLTDAPRVVVDETLRDGLSFMTGLLDPDPTRRSAARAQLPEALADWDGGLVMELGLTIMPVVSGRYVPIRGSLPSTASEQTAFAEGLAACADLLRSWPDAFTATIGRWFDDHVGSTFETEAGRRSLCRSLPALASPFLPARVRDAVLGALGPVTAVSGVRSDDRIGMKTAQKMLGVEVAFLTRMRRQGALRARGNLRNGRVMPALDRAEVERIHDLKENRVSPERFSRAMEMPSYAAFLVAGRGRIGLERHPFVIARYGEAQLHRTEADRFTDALRGQAEAVIDPNADAPSALLDILEKPVALHRVVRAIGGGLKPWDVIVDALLGGKMRFVMTEPRCSRLWIDESDAATLRGIGPSTLDPRSISPTCSQRDGLEILNLRNQQAALLKTYAKAGHDWEMEWDAVLELAGDRISAAEICARTGMQIKTLQAWPMISSLPRDDFGWWRKEALEVLDRHADATGAKRGSIVLRAPNKAWTGSQALSPKSEAPNVAMYER